MRTRLCFFICALMMSVPNATVAAEVFGTGANQFTIDFVTISFETNPTQEDAIPDIEEAGWLEGRPEFIGAIDDDFRIGKFEITNDQWSKFERNLGVPLTGSNTGYTISSYYTGDDFPTTGVSWFEAAQFVNWLNTSQGYHEAYKFTGTQGNSDYTFELWSATEAADSGKLFRHKDAFYFLPSEDEWVKAAYWNGIEYQHYATKPSETFHQGDGISGTGWNYDRIDGADDCMPWAVGSGSEELNGTYDMMGNVGEWTDSAHYDREYTNANYASRTTRGGAYHDYWGKSGECIVYNSLNYEYAGDATSWNGFRIASKVPEPSSLGLVWLGGLMLLRKRH